MTVTVACPDMQTLLQLALGQMPPEEVERLAKHCEQCPACIAVLHTLKAEDTLIEALVAQKTTPDQPLDPAVNALIELFRCVRPIVPPPDLGATPAEDNTSSAGGPTPLEASAEITPEVYAFLSPSQGPGEIGRLGPYGVLKSLGSGGMGVVFLARQARPHRLVALKMILAGRPGRERLARFRSEVELIARLRHPHVVQVYEAGEHDGRPYYAMELVEGGSLAEQLAAAPLPAPAAARLVQTLARAVQHAHDKGVVHRDLKPSNVLLTDDGTPKITDFGLAKQLEGEAEVCPGAPRTESGVILGTPGYMAPEQAADGREVGPAADVYALGAILYECLTGRPPFKAATVLETLEQVRSQEPVPIVRLQPRTPRDLQTICLKCLEKGPARRYASAAELADDLGRFLDGKPIEARPVSLYERLLRCVRHHPALAALLAVSGLSLAALMAGSLVFNARLRAAVATAEAKEEEARRQHVLARDNFTAAHDALSRILDRLERQAEGGQPHELERDLREEVLTFYRNLQGVNGDDLSMRLTIIWGIAAAGARQLVQGQHGPAEKNLRRAVALLEELPPEQRSPVWQDRLAECYLYLGMLAGDTGRPDEKEHAYRQVLAIRQRLVETEPDKPAWQKNLAQAELLLGTVCQFSGRCPEAETRYTRAVALYTRLVETHPRENYRDELATAHVNLGHLYQQTARSEEAEAAFTRAEGLLVPLAQAHPEKLQYTLSLTSLNITWSGFLLETGRPGAARQRAGRAVDLSKDALRRDPQLVIPRAHAREAHLKRAMACEALGHWAEAVEDWDRVIELDDQPEPWKRRVRRALALARAGQHARAAPELGSLADNPALDADGLWQLVIARACSVQAARSDSRLPADERETLAERYASRAVVLLRKLRKKGYFRAAEKARQLRTNPDLQPLCGGADFRNFLLGEVTLTQSP
jgi:tetratricopeptide (TPR) repeat protein